VSVNAHNRLADQVTIRENKLSLVERLADDLAHEIKNPLHSMVINLEVLRRRLTRLEQGSGDDLLRYAGVLSSELERVNRRVDLLLRMVRPHRDSDDPTTLADVLEELRELVELECERHEVECQLDPPKFMLRARLPRAATRQMILSLILNTLDAIPPRGTLNVTSELGDDWLRVRFHGLQPDGSAVALSAGDEHENYLHVARALAERLGGTLQLEASSDAPSPEPDGPAGSYVLYIPRDGPDDAPHGTSDAAIG
jgi:two-component system, NtrC family, sensor histidine kinase HydH